MAMVIADNHPAANANSTRSVSDDNTGILNADTLRTTMIGPPAVTPERCSHRSSLPNWNGTGANGCGSAAADPSSDTPSPDDPSSPDDRRDLGASSDGCCFLTVPNGSGTTTTAAGLSSWM